MKGSWQQGTSKPHIAEKIFLVWWGNNYRLAISISPLSMIQYPLILACLSLLSLKRCICSSLALV